MKKFLTYLVLVIFLMTTYFPLLALGKSDSQKEKTAIQAEQTKKREKFDSFKKVEEKEILPPWFSKKKKAMITPQFWPALLSIFCLIFLGGVLHKKFATHSLSSSESLQILGELSLNSSQKLTLVQVKNKCLLLSVNKDGIVLLKEMEESSKISLKEVMPL